VVCPNIIDPSIGKNEFVFVDDDAVNVDDDRSVLVPQDARRWVRRRFTPHAHSLAHLEQPRG
jgi:hypothetical protein